MEVKVSEIRRRKSNRVLYRILKKLFILIAIVGIPTILFIINFKIEKVGVIGANQYSEEQIKDSLFQSKIDQYSICLYLKHRFFKQNTLPFIEKIDVKMEDNHSVKIYVYEKMIAGCVEFMGEYLYFDKEGIVVESTSSRQLQVPIIKGLKFNEIILNEKLNVQKEELFRVILNITQLIGKYELDVDTISFNSGYEVTIDSADITVLLGKKSTYDEALAELKNILAKAEGMKIEIDMRDYVKGMDSFIAKPKKSTE